MNEAAPKKARHSSLTYERNTNIKVEGGKMLPTQIKSQKKKKKRVLCDIISEITWI